MNNPRRTKRFDLECWKTEFSANMEIGSGHFGMALDVPEFGHEFALLVSEFTHLEIDMERILARLLRVDNITAAHVMRSILSVKARIEMMRAVLQRARHTAAFPKEFDEILNEFADINKERNRLVHARWYTDINTGTVYIIRPNDDPMLLDMAAMTEFKLSEIKEVRTRLLDLFRKISRVVAQDIERAPPEE